MKNIIFTLFCLFFAPLNMLMGQAAINTDGSAPSPNTILDLNPAVGKAFIPPTMNWAQIKAITPAKAGMVVYDSEFNCLRMHNGTKWVRVGEQADLFAPPGSFTTQTANGRVYPNGVITDASGNVYITGYFSGTATFGNLTALTSAGDVDVFIAKYNNSGTVVWVQKAGGTGEDISNGIVLDGLGNLYITGHFEGTATFGNSSTVTLVGNDDIFIAKYNNSGAFLWVQKAGGTNFDGGNSIATFTDNLGNVSIYIIGNFTGTATFGTLSTITSAGSFDVFVAKYTSSGTAVWVQKVGGVGDDYGRSIALDGSGNVFITGSFTGTATFGSLPTTITSAGNYDAFVARLVSSDGFFAWVRQVGGPNYDNGNSIALDAANNVYVTGSFSGAANLGLTSVGGFAADMFIIKYASTGTVDWAMRAGGIGEEVGRSITLDALGNIYITGTFSSTSTFGTFPTLRASTLEWNKTVHSSGYNVQYRQQLRDKSGRREQWHHQQWHIGDGRGIFESKQWVCGKWGV